MSWDHGYHSKTIYTADFYREMAPNWMDFALLVKGVRPPRDGEGSPFRYLDLGCGMGFGLCLLAVLYPEGEFVGVDFLPAHISHARGMANALEIGNVRFLELDLLKLAQRPGLLEEEVGAGSQHYAVAHGVATWVRREVQDALLKVASVALQPGGIFYCSYNCQPGWLAKSLLHHLVGLELSRTDRSQTGEAIERARSSLAGLLTGGSGGRSHLAEHLPCFEAELAELARCDPRYLSQEYGNAGWNPLHVAEMHALCGAHKLSFAATATLPELFPELLPSPLQAKIQEEVNPGMRETLIDLATMKSFRRDLFVKGEVSLTRTERLERLGEVRLRIQEAPQVEDCRFSTSFGDLLCKATVFLAVEEHLKGGVSSLEELSQTLINCEEILAQIALLLHQGRLGLDRGDAVVQALPGCRSANEAIINWVMKGRQYRFLAAVPLGTAVSISPLEALFCRGLQEGLEGEMLGLWMAECVEALDIRIQDSQGRVIQDPQKKFDALMNNATNFYEIRAERLHEICILK